MKELHIWLESPKSDIIAPYKLCKSYIKTGKAILNDDNIIHTTQPHFLKFCYGYELYVHIHKLDKNGHHITLGQCEGLDFELKDGNIEELLFNGTFNWF